MPFEAGARLGQYEILTQVGVGGMGEVFRARDTRLGRDVAVKVLPDLFAADPDRLLRFEREAQVLASLNHPHIAQVFGVHDSPAALVMEFVDGEDLAQRLARGAVPVREALDIARQVADALDAAHSQGIVHRDLKPANVKVREDGTVKVLDFGLAKAMDPVPSNVSVHPMHSPTITSPAQMTRMGVILGTAAYMAPEQAKGKSVDRGADLWAFGVVLYEMLTGGGAFEGETITDVLAAIVTRDPDWTALPVDTPASIVRLLRRCLERDRRKRLADAGEARFQIEEALAAPAVVPSSEAVESPSRRGVVTYAPWVLATVLGVVVIGLGVREWRQPPPVTARYALELPANAAPALTNRPAVAITPDDSAVVFLASVDGVDRLYVRHRNTFDATALPGTDGASHPVISPDGRWIAFTANGKLVKVPLNGGPAVSLAAVADPRGLTWDSPDRIHFVPGAVGGVFRVAAGGGTAEQVTFPTENVERTHRWVQELPGGALLYTVGNFGSPDNYDDAVIEAVKPGTREKTTILSGAAIARYVPATRTLVFVRGTTMFAVPFDVEKLAVTGTAAPVLEGVAGDTTTGAAHFAISARGTLVYLTSGAQTGLLLPTWVTRSGVMEPLQLQPGNYSDPRISPDGQAVAFSVVTGGGRDIWVHSFARKTITRLTFEGRNTTPLWSPDAKHIYYVALDAGDRNSTLVRRPADGSGDAEPLVTFEDRVYLEDMMPGGRSAAVTRISRGSAVADIEVVELSRGAKPSPVVATRFDEFSPRVSPDGRWIAYTSAESGRPEVFVRAAASGGGRWQVSTSGGEEPNWSRDGKQLLYRNGNFLMGVTLVGTGAFETSPPVRVLSGMYNLRNDSGVTYAVDPKSERLLTIAPPQQAADSLSLRVIVNWTRELGEAAR